MTDAFLINHNWLERSDLGEIEFVLRRPGQLVFVRSLVYFNYLIRPIPSPFPDVVSLCQIIHPTDPLNNLSLYLPITPPTSLPSIPSNASFSRGRHLRICFFAIRIARYDHQQLDSSAYLSTPLAALGVVPQSNINGSTIEPLRLGCCGCALRLEPEPSLSRATGANFSEALASKDARTAGRALAPATRQAARLEHISERLALQNDTNGSNSIQVRVATLESSASLVQTFANGQHSANCRYKHPAIEITNDKGIQ